MIINPSPIYMQGSVTYERNGSDLIINGQTVTPGYTGEGEIRATTHPLIVKVDGGTVTVLAYQPADTLEWFPESVELADGDSVTYSHG